MPATDVVMRLREAKDAEEVEGVRRACEHIQAVYDELWATLAVGAIEADVNAHADYLLKRRGAREAGRTSSSAATPRTRTARRTRARSRPATWCAPTSRRSSTATGAT